MEVDQNINQGDLESERAESPSLDKTGHSEAEELEAHVTRLKRQTINIMSWTILLSPMQSMTSS